MSRWEEWAGRHPEALAHPWRHAVKAGGAACIGVLVATIAIGRPWISIPAALGTWVLVALGWRLQIAKVASRVAASGGDPDDAAGPPARPGR